jgi:hypothetical protein
MDKNWLIRTKSNHILGPISKEKVIELYKNGSIKPDDEVCCGNGYWFFIREDDMVERFLTGNEFQTFNPISEAKDVLTHSSQSRMSETPTEDITLVGGLNLSMLKQPATAGGPGIPPIPEMPAPMHKSPATKEPVSPETKKKNNVVVKSRPSSERIQKPLKKQNYIKYIGIFGFVILLLLVYFRKSIIQSLFQGEITSSFSLISPAHAQEDVPGKKKSY